MIFDAHTHFFPDKLKGKVLPKLSEVSGHEYFGDGTLEGTVKFQKDSGCRKFLALHIATNPTQQSAVNDFAISSQCENILNFGSVNHQSDNAVEELLRLYEAGIKGIKLHPDYQDYFVDDERMDEVYKTCEKLGLIITFHAGRDPYSPNIVHSHPKDIKKVATKFPNLKIIAAHMGGMNMSAEVLEHLVGLSNVYFDTAMCSEFLSKEMAEKIIRAHGVSKILFGTDLPWSTIEREKELIDSLDLSIDEKEMIYYKNAEKLFKLSEK